MGKTKELLEKLHNESIEEILAEADRLNIRHEVNACAAELIKIYPEYTFIKAYDIAFNKIAFDETYH